MPLFDDVDRINQRSFEMANAVMHTTGAVLPRAPGAAVGLVSGVGVLGISIGAPAVGALFAATGGFSLPFGVLAAFSLLVLWVLGSL